MGLIAGFFGFIGFILCAATGLAVHKLFTEDVGLTSSDSLNQVLGFIAGVAVFIGSILLVNAVIN